MLLAKAQSKEAKHIPVSFFILSLGLILSLLMPKVVGGSANDAASFEAKAEQPASQERGYGGRKDVAAMISATRGGREAVTEFMTRVARLGK